MRAVKKPIKESASETASTKAPTGKRPGRQRSTAADEAILSAALEILMEGGYGNFTMNSVISRAGVSSATLYRRWASADELVLAALRSIQTETVEIDSGSLAGDLEAFIHYLADALKNMGDIAVAEASGPRAPVSLRDEVAKMFAEPRMKLLSNIMKRAQRRGELTSVPSSALCWTYVVSPVHHWLYLQGKSLTPDFVRSTRTLLVAGLKALAESKKT